MRRHIHTWTQVDDHPWPLHTLRRCECGVVQQADTGDVLRARVPESLECYADVVWEPLDAEMCDTLRKYQKRLP
jgi:hypothetical protein